MKALLIDVDFRTGKRAGGRIQTKNNPNLMCHGWQDLDEDGDGTNGKEIRQVMDEKTAQYENIPGIVILNNKAEINAAIDANIPTKYGVKDSSLMATHMLQKGISLDTLAGKSMKEIAAIAFAQGLAGVTERKPEKVK